MSPTEDDLDLVARYLILRLNLAVETNDRYSQAPRPLIGKWQKQLEEAKRDLIANGLATKI